LLGGLGHKRDVPDAAAMSPEAVAELVKDGSTVLAVSYLGEVHDITDAFKSALSTRDIVNDVVGSVDGVFDGLLILVGRDVSSTAALPHKDIADLFKKGGKLVAVDPSKKVYDITSTFVPALTTRTLGVIGDALNGLTGVVDNAEGTVDSALSVIPIGDSVLPGIL
jgi:hypothetical protein